jgi:hypothetical protein
VSQQFADRYLGDVNPLDRRVALNDPGSPATLAPQIEWEIVGVYHTINNSQELGDVSRPEVMLPFWQSPWLDAAVAVRTSPVRTRSAARCRARSAGQAR